MGRFMAAVCTPQHFNNSRELFFWVLRRSGKADRSFRQGSSFLPFFSGAGVFHPADYCREIQPQQRGRILRQKAGLLLQKTLKCFQVIRLHSGLINHVAGGMGKPEIVELLVLHYPLDHRIGHMLKKTPADVIDVLFWGSKLSACLGAETPLSSAIFLRTKPGIE